VLLVQLSSLLKVHAFYKFIEVLPDLGASLVLDLLVHLKASSWWFHFFSVFVEGEGNQRADFAVEAISTLVDLICHRGEMHNLANIF